MRPEENCHTHHRVRLPDGREIEVVYLDRGGKRLDPPSDQRAQEGDGGSQSAPSLANEPPQSAPTLALEVCFHCGGDLVHPLDWADEGGGSWRILLRCPECEATREGVFGRDSIEEFEDELDRGIASLLSDLRRMTHTNMTEEIEFFVRALEADVIVPSDF